MSSVSGVFVVDASKLNLSEQEATVMSEAIIKATMLEIAKLDRTVSRGVDIDKINDPLIAARGIGGIGPIAGFTISSESF